MKHAIIVMSDPTQGGDDALGRAFNALALAYDLRQHDQPVELVFQGAGTRWPERLRDPAHPAHALYAAVEPSVAGVSCACADVFGARESAERLGLSLITTNGVPGTTGLASIASYAAAGDRVYIF